MAGIPAFRSFTSTFNVLLKDGQTAQHTAATDPVSGEVLRVDVTLTRVEVELSSAGDAHPRPTT